jgi:DNA repair protein SbcD/Mre11
MVKVLHFADAHIDMANYGRHDPETGLPFRVLDFLKSLDTIVDAAIDQKVDLVLFSGDAYKDRTPAPTYQREWGKRMMRLSRAGIPTLLLIGNHDISPAVGRASSIQEYETLDVPHIHVISKPCFLGPSDLEGCPVQIIGLPWITRGTVAAAMLNMDPDSDRDPLDHLQETYSNLVAWMLENADPALPVILMAHASVEGAKYGAERSVMLGTDFTLSPAMVKDSRLAYTALGHIHKQQDLNEGLQPPVVYPGSIERVDFGEAGDEKFYVIAEVEKSQTVVHFQRLTGIRPFIDRFVALSEGQDVTNKLMQALPEREKIKEAVVRLTIEYPRALEAQIDENALREYTSEAFEFHIIRRPLIETRIRLGKDQSITSLSETDLTDIYWKSIHLSAHEQKNLQELAATIIKEVQTGSAEDEMEGEYPS